MECNLCGLPITNGPETFWSAGPDPNPYCGMECYRTAVNAGEENN